MERTPNSITPDSAEKVPFFKRIIGSVIRCYNYATGGVWSDTRNTFGVNLVKTINLSVRSFLNGELQLRAGSLTYQTLLAIVPALALVFAIGRGFGFQNLLQTQLFEHFPAQRQALSTAFTFVDSYLAQSSEGIFVGVGILFLLWTLISLITNVEDVFNLIWGIKQGRSLWRKITDYTAIVLILPILMICASGIMVFMSSTLTSLLPAGFFSPLLKVLFDLLSLVMTWLFFAGSYMLIPNTRVRFGNAFLAGMMAGTAFSILQWLFVSGQIYVTRYNAIYGSFAFLPLLLIWLQLVWTITLAGAVVCFSSQNIFEFSFNNEIAKISNNYKWRLTIAVMTIAVDRYLRQFSPLTPHQIAVNYELPITLVNDAAHKLEICGLLYKIAPCKSDEECAIAPAIDPSIISVGMIADRLGSAGSEDFIPHFKDSFQPINDALTELRRNFVAMADKIYLKDYPVEQAVAAAAADSTTSSVSTTPSIK